MATAIKNNGTRAVALFDGTLLVPTETTAISEETLKKLKETKFGAPGPDGNVGTQLDSLLQNHDLELVEGQAAEDASYAPPADQSKTPADQAKTKLPPKAPVTGLTAKPEPTAPVTNYPPKDKK